MSEQKTAIVTGGAGASAGASGRYISLRLAEMGYFVAVWDIQDEAGRAVAEEIRAAGATRTRCRPPWPGPSPRPAGWTPW